MSKVSSLIHDQSLLITRSLLDTHAVHTSLNTVINATNTLKKALSTTNRKLDDEIRFNRLDTQLSLLFGDVLVMTTLYDAFLEDLVTVSRGQVSPSLLPVPTLSGVVREAMVKHHLQPLFSLDNLLLYYPYLQGSMDAKCFVITIPFRPSISYLAFKIHPFPFVVDGKTVTLALQHDLLLMTKDKLTYSAVDSDLLNSCVSGFRGMFVCLDYSVPQLSILPSSCMRSLLLNVNVTGNCRYMEIELLHPHHISLHRHHFIFFPTPTPVVTTCQGTASHHTLTGPYVLPFTCSLTSPVIKLDAVRQMVRAYSPWVPHLEPVKLILPRNESLVLPKHISLLNTPPSLPWFASPHFSIGFPISFSAILVMTLFLLLFLCRHRLLRSVTVQSVVPAKSSESDI